MEIDFFASKWGSSSQLESIKLRENVLRRPLGLTFSDKELMEERDQHHLIAQIKKHVVGILILSPSNTNEIKMRQVAIHPSYQNKGVGSQLVFFAEEYAIKLCFQKMTLHARKTAFKFYQKLKYKTNKKPFLEVGIPHYLMWKNLL